MKNNIKVVSAYIGAFIIWILLVKFSFSLLSDQFAVQVSANMEPAYSKGDLLHYKQFETYEVGSAIIIETGKGLMVTRIFAINIDGTYEAQGDNNAGQIDNCDSQGCISEHNIESLQVIGKILYGISNTVYYPVILILVFVPPYFVGRTISKKYVQNN